MEKRNKRGHGLTQDQIDALEQLEAEREVLRREKFLHWFSGYGRHL